MSDKPADSTASPARTAGRIVILLDRSPFTAPLLQSALRPDGWTLVSVRNPASALEAMGAARAQQASVPMLILGDAENGAPPSATLAGLLDSPVMAGAQVLVLCTDTEEMAATLAGRPEVVGYLAKPLKASDAIAAVREATQASASEESGAKASAADAPAYLRILLAEDNITNQKVVSKQLERYRLDVQIAEDGSVAVRRWQSEPFDLVLMDVNMPVLDGIGATRRIRELEVKTGQRIPIIGLTAQALLETEAQCREAGMDAYLHKPINREQLVKTIRQYRDFPLQEIVSVAPPPTAMSGANLVKPERLLEDLGGNYAAFRRLAGDVVGEIRGQVDALKAAVAAGDSEGVRQVAHAFKTTFAHWGVDRGRSLAVRIETFILTHNFSLALEKVPSLETLALEVAGEIEKLSREP